MRFTGNETSYNYGNLSFAYYEQGLRKYDLDSKLERIKERTVSASDMRPQATSTDWSPWDEPRSIVKADGRIEQIIYKNK